jgi:hypothetical protein
MSFEITDQQLVVGTLTFEDVIDLPADDTVASASWTSADSTDASTDVTVVAGDASSGTNDGDLSAFTVSATGAGEGAVAITGTLVMASGNTVIFSDTGTVNGGAAVSAAATYGSPQAIPPAA